MWWLTKNPSWEVPMWAEGTPDKLDVRLTVEVDDAVRWRRFAQRQRIPADVLTALNDGGDPENWYVVVRPVRVEEVVAVEVNPTPSVERGIIERKLLGFLDGAR
jgi:hypothetical protein